MLRSWNWFQLPFQVNHELSFLSVFGKIFSLVKKMANDFFASYFIWSKKKFCEFFFSLNNFFGKTFLLAKHFRTKFDNFLWFLDQVALTAAMYSQLTGAELSGNPYVSTSVAAAASAQQHQNDLDSKAGLFVQQYLKWQRKNKSFFSVEGLSFWIDILTIFLFFIKLDFFF